MPYGINLHETRYFNIPVPAGKYQTDLNFMRFICSQFNRRLSVNIAIVGEQQIGKSAMGIWLYAQIARAFKVPFNLRDTIYYEPLAMVENMPDSFFYTKICDEAANILHRKEWYKQSHIALSKLITTQGFRVMCGIWVTPFMSDLDKSFHKYFHLVFYVKERGRVKCWRYKARHDQPEGEEIKKVFYDDFKFTLADLPPGAWEEYKPWSIAEKEKIRAKYAAKHQREENDFEKLRAAIEGLKIGRRPRQIGGFNDG